MAKLTEILRGLATMVDDVEEQAKRSDDPLDLIQTILGHANRSGDGEKWWELFGLEDQPTDTATLKGAWRSWCARNHPDAGGPAAAFRRMEQLYARQLAKLERSA